MRVLLVILILLALAGCSGESAVAGDGAEETASEPGATTTNAATSSGLRTMTIDASGDDEVTVRVEIADDASERARGLMYRTALAEDQGMLFVFPDEDTLTFWMKNTLIPLSIAFIDSEGRIVDLQDMKPLDDEPPSYVSAEPARYALEVNQGFFEEHGIQVGDRADLPI